MKLEEFLAYVNQGLAIPGGPEIHLYMNISFVGKAALVTGGYTIL
jgi:hypothetical protein